MTEKQAMNTLYRQLLNEGEQGISMHDIQQVYKLTQSLNFRATPCKILAKALKMIDEAREIECTFRELYEREAYETLLKRRLSYNI